MPRTTHTDVILYEKLAKTVVDSITSDDYTLWKKGQRIFKLYTNADERTKTMFDNLFVTLCGNTLKSIIDDINTQPKENINEHRTT